MAEQVLIPIKQAGQTAAELNVLNPIGFERQLVFETDTLRAKLLDGVTAYNDLPYIFESAAVVWGGIGGTLSDQIDLQNALNAKQDTLISQTNIKSINGVSLLGSGDLVVGGAVDSVNGQTGVVVLDTGDIASVLNYRYVTDAQLNVINNTSGINTGDQDLSPYLTIANAASTYLALSGGTLTGSLSLGANGLTVNNILASQYRAGNLLFDSSGLKTTQGGSAGRLLYSSSDYNFTLYRYLGINVTGASGKILNLNGISATDVILTLNGVASQTGHYINVLDSASANIFRVTKDGDIYAKNTTSAPFYLASSVRLAVNEITAMGNNTTLEIIGNNNEAWTISGSIIRIGYVSVGQTVTTTSGDVIGVNFSNNFSPTSGTATWQQISISGTVNQTGGANGIARGIYVNPTLTSASDWRSIETSNNSGYAIYAGGTAPSYINGKFIFNDLIQFAGTTSSYPALKRSSTELQVRLADDSGFAPLQASQFYSNDGYLGYGKIVVSTGTSGSPTVLTAADSGKHYINTGASAETYINLPTAVAGLRFRFTTNTNQRIRVVAATGDIIRFSDSSASSSGGYARSTNASAGIFIELEAVDATYWQVVSVTISGGLPFYTLA